MIHFINNRQHPVGAGQNNFNLCKFLTTGSHFYPFASPPFIPSLSKPFSWVFVEATLMSTHHTYYRASIEIHDHYSYTIFLNTPLQ